MTHPGSTADAVIVLLSNYVALQLCDPCDATLGAASRPQRRYIATSQRWNTVAYVARPGRHALRCNSVAVHLIAVQR